MTARGTCPDQSKERAARSGRTIGEIVEDALRAQLFRHPDAAAELAALPTFGGSGVLPGVDLASSGALRETMDEDLPLDARR